MPFHDRDDAGIRLAARVASQQWESPLVLALPRGGVPVAAHVASALGTQLEPFVARKIGGPGQPEFGIGALAEGSDEVLVTEAVDQLGVNQEQLQSLVEDERTELQRQIKHFRGGRPLPPLEHREVILVDDGLATGVTAEAALRALRRGRPRRLVLAVPVCARDTARRVGGIADEVICLESPENFGAVGSWYENFSQTSDDEVLALLAEHAPAERESADPQSADFEFAERDITVEISGGGVLHGDLAVPGDASGVVLFAHGSGSSRRSPRNRQVAQSLHERRLATLLVDLLTEDEDREDARTGELRFDIALLADRLLAATRWLAHEESTARLPLGYFGASTGAAAALVAAAELPEGQVQAVVSRGGRPDLAGDALAQVTAPTLLLVGGRDDVVLALNRMALQQLGGACRLEVVEGATHLFEEPGALEEVARLAGDWFTTHLRR